MNTDVRLVEDNEYMVTHELLLGEADWVQKCRGKLQVITYVLNIMCACCVLYLDSCQHDHHSLGLFELARSQLKFY